MLLRVADDAGHVAIRLGHVLAKPPDVVPTPGDEAKAGAGGAACCCGQTTRRCPRPGRLLSYPRPARR